jgi:hypothetical protein
MNQAAQTARVSPTRTEPVFAAETYRPPFLWAFAAAAALFVLYAVTLAPTTAFWDTSEYIATAHVLGVPHPPGNPTFVLLAKAWSLLLSPLGLPVAVRINLFSAFMTAGASFFWFLVVHRILAYFTPSELVRRVGAAAAVIVSGTAFTVWNQSNVNEKVYTVTLFTIALMSWVAFRWRDQVEAQPRKKTGRWQSDNAMLLVIYILAASVGNHLMAGLAVPALIIFVLLVKPTALFHWRLYAFGLPVILLGLSMQLYLPIRSDLDPVINEAAPKCDEGVGVGAAMPTIFTFGRATGDCPMLASALKREQYQKPPWWVPANRQAPFGRQMQNFFQYFEWQWSRSLEGVDGYFAASRIPFMLLFLGLGIWGGVEHYGRDRKSFWYIATLYLTLSVGLVVYMNFKYGYMQGQVIGQQNTEVRERDYFYICTFSVWGLWVGVGLTALWLRLADSLGRSRKAILTAAPVMLIALLPLGLNWKYATRAGDYAARDFAYNLLQSVEPYGVLITNGDNDTFPLWYVQEVEGIRRDVTVIVMSYLNTGWYVKQLRDLSQPCPRPGASEADPTVIICQRPFDASKAPGFYANAKVPAKPILPLNDVQIDQVAGGYAMEAGEGLTYQARGQTFAIEPGTVLSPAHQFLATMLTHAWGDRPIHFASTTYTHAELGLLGHVTRTGMSFKLVTPQEAQAAQLTPMPADPNIMQFTGGYMDIDRNRAMLEREAQYHGLAQKAVWADDATRNIPMQYTYAWLALATAERVRRNDQQAARDEARAQEFQALADR